MQLDNKAMFFYYADWVMSHPRYGMIMMLLILSSFTQNHILATILFILFSIELSIRIPIVFRKIKSSDLYRRSLACKMEWLLTGLDVIAVLSLLVTVFQVEYLLGDLALIRLVRGLYLLRTLRILRYLDVQNIIYSSTYGIIISIIVLSSFFAEGLFLWAIIVFFSIELIIRAIILRNTAFVSKRERLIEWVLWWVDLVATIAMLPVIANTAIGASLRVLRLIRLLRPWYSILRNLISVIREGQFMQEVNLVILLLAVFSIGGGVAAPFLMDDEFDFDRDGIISERDNTILAKIWFAFRAFTDPGNVVYYTDQYMVIIFSIISVVVGVFLFAFFIGIGVNIVDGMMKKLRNEDVNINNHIVMIGWNATSKHVMQQLQRFSTLSFKKLKMVVLNREPTPPEDYKGGKWASYRWGEVEDEASLRRINVGTASHAIINMPDGKSAADELAHGFLAQLSLRRINPDLSVNCVTPGDPHPRLAKYKHQLQIGWDRRNHYDAPTVIESNAEIHANLLKQVIFYHDFDQVMSLLMIPVRPGSSSLHAAQWKGRCMHEEGQCYLQSENGQDKMEIGLLTKTLFKRGVMLLGIADDQMRIDNVGHPVRVEDVFALIGICSDTAVLHDEVEYVLRHADDFADIGAEARMIEMAPLALKTPRIKIAIIGRIGRLRMILKSLLPEYEELEVVILDQISDEERLAALACLNDSLNEIEGAQERVILDIIPWDFSDMAILETHISKMDRIFIACPAHVVDKPHAIIASVLSHTLSILEDHESEALIFPVMDSREQARMLQEELYDFEVDDQVHVVVPGEFYGAYVAHTTFNMFRAITPDDYKIQGILHNTLEDLMAEADDDCFDVHGFKIEGELEKDPQALFNALLDQGNLWIGYRLDASIHLDSRAYKSLTRLFPRASGSDCIRQERIILNPFNSPLSEKIWYEMHDNIIELIAIRFTQPEEDLLDDIFF